MIKTNKDKLLTLAFQGEIVPAQVVDAVGGAEDGAGAGLAGTAEKSGRSSISASCRLPPSRSPWVVVTLALAASQLAGLRFVEVFVDCSLRVAEERDPKGLYKKARAGEIKNFTGIDDPYEAPIRPELHLHTDQMTLEHEVAVIVDFLLKEGIITDRQLGAANDTGAYAAAV